MTSIDGRSPGQRRATGPTSICVAPDPAAPGRNGSFVSVLNSPGIVTITSPPSDMAWPIRTVTIDGTPQAAPPWVVRAGGMLWFGVRSSDSPVPGILSFAGNQQNSPFNLNLAPAATCP